MTLSPLVLLVLALASSAEPAPVYKIVTRRSFASTYTTSTDYYSGSKHRIESRSAGGYRNPLSGGERMSYGPVIAYISDGANGEWLEINLDDRTYAQGNIPPRPNLEEIKARMAQMPKPAAPAAAKVTIEMNVTDTGERKDFFGHQARHYIVERKTIPHADSAKQPQQSTTDGWYIDFNPYEPGGSPWLKEAPRQAKGAGTFAYLDAGPFEPTEFRRHGPAVSGFPVKMVITTHMTHKLPDGTVKEFGDRSEIEVVELSKLPWDATLFQPPAGFKKVDRVRTEPEVPLSVRAATWWVTMKQRIADLFR